MRILLPLYFLLMVQTFLAQTPINLAVISDEKPDSELESQYEKKLQNEILQLLQHRFKVEINTFYLKSGENDFAKLFSDAYANNDVVIGLGTNSSNFAINLKEYPKPTIASIVLDAELQRFESNDSKLLNYNFHG